MSDITIVHALSRGHGFAKQHGDTLAVGFHGSGRKPSGRVIIVDYAGALHDGLSIGSLVTANKVVDRNGKTLWENAPLQVRGAKPCIVLASEKVIDDPEERRELLLSTKAEAVHCEIQKCLECADLIGAVFGITDGPATPLGLLAAALHPNGDYNWPQIWKAFRLNPVGSIWTSVGVMRVDFALRNIPDLSATHAS